MCSALILATFLRKTLQKVIALQFDCYMAGFPIILNQSINQKHIFSDNIIYIIL